MLSMRQCLIAIYDRDHLFLLSPGKFTVECGRLDHAINTSAKRGPRNFTRQKYSNSSLAPKAAMNLFFRSIFFQLTDLGDRAHKAGLLLAKKRQMKFN
jgi:hypothetical protein